VLPLPARRLLRQTISRSKQVMVTSYAELVRKSALQRVTGPHLLVNLGCGVLHRPGWINVDKELRPGVYYADLANGIPLRDEAAKHINCEHFLEHLEYSTAKKFLRECFRVLEHGGTLRIILPDAEKYIHSYCANDLEFFDKLRYLGGATEGLRTRVEVLNQMFRMGGVHLFAWDFETLSLHLREASFVEVRRSSYGDVEPTLNIDGAEAWRSLESLYVNARK